MSDALVCWRCGRPLGDLPLPLGRRSECPACHAELHVCRMCRHFDPAKARQCREPMAEEVKDKLRANFCDWFQPRTDAHAETGRQPAPGGRAALDALFGGEADRPPRAEDPRRALDDLFGGGD